MSVVLSTEEAVCLRELARQCRKTNDPNDIRRLANMIEYRMANINRSRTERFVIYKPTDQRAKVMDRDDGTVKLKFRNGQIKYTSENQTLPIILAEGR